MQTNPSSKTNLDRCIDVIEWWLQQISIANGFITDGPIVVNRSHDPRLLKDDQLSGYRKSCCRATIKVGDQILLRSGTSGMRGTLGGVKRDLVKCEIIVNQSLSKDQDDAGVTIDKIQSWLTDDWKFRCVYRLDVNGNPQFLPMATAALAAKDPTWKTPSMINPLVTKVLAGPALNFPNAVMVWQMEWESDCTVRRFAQANL